MRAVRILRGRKRRSGVRVYGEVYARARAVYLIDLISLMCLTYETYETYDSVAFRTYETYGRSIRPPVSEVYDS